jgi:hypothetical protein
LGINPGVTSAKEAQTRLKALDNITRVHLTKTSMEMVWSDDTQAVVYFEKSLVQSIYLSNLYAFWPLHYFTRVWGEPDEIRIAVFQTQHCDDVTYLLYYPSKKAALFVSLGSWDGPNPNDFVDQITVNTEFDDETLRERYLQPRGWNNDYLSDRQPWLGFGHLRDYLPTRQLPAGPCRPPEAIP